jgi:putative FmdB family regulatory protein
VPTYQYACTTCDEQIEVVQRFTDDPLTDCPACAGRLRKVFSPVGVVFKGSGFYKTDSRGSRSSSSSAPAKPAAESTAAKPAESSSTTTSTDTAAAS